MSTIDLELTIRAGIGQGYLGEIRCSWPGSDAAIDTSAMPSPVIIDHARLRELTLDPAAYGLALGQMLLADPQIARIFAQARALSQREQVPLRLLLVLAADAAELHALRWETLCDPTSPTVPLLTTSAQVVFSRYLSSTDWQPLRRRAKGKFHALVVLASPPDLPDYGLAPLDLQAECALIKQSFGPISTTVLATRQASLDALMQHLHDGYDILYLLAHGRANEATGDTWLYLEGCDGRTEALLGSTLAHRIAELAARPQLIVLGSCESAGDGHGSPLLALGPQLAQVGVGAVLAMQARITVKTLRHFLSACLQALARDGKIDRAVAVARGAVHDRPDFWVPVLFLRLKSGHLWDDTEDDLRAKLADRRALLRVLLEQARVAGTSTPIPPHLRASVVQLQAEITTEKARLREAGMALIDEPEDAAHLPAEAGGLISHTSNWAAQSQFFGPVTIVQEDVSKAPAPDPYAQYRDHLLRLLPALDAQSQPYLGLQTFQFEHADRFFGRDALVAELAERLGRAPFLAVLGASGSGKSSLVRAGLLPLLKAGGLPGSEHWRYITLTPGARPLDTLAAVLSEASGSSLSETLELASRLAGDAGALLLLARRFAPRLVLVVDQAEELWTLQPADTQQRILWQEQQQQPFLRLLLSVLGVQDRPLLVILAMRADFLHRAGANATLARAISDHMVLISCMSVEELRAAIERPARQAGGRFEPGLVDELIEQAQDEDGSLPLLEYTLQELWSQRQGDGPMTWASYRALGGVEGALTKRADGILQQHYTPAQQDEVRQVLLRLIQPGEGAADTRRRVALADLATDNQSPEAVQRLLQPLIDARLLTTGQERGQPAAVEVSHEALIRSWPSLRSWIDEARADLRLQIQLEEAAKEWQASDNDTSLLWDGLRLSNTEAWLLRTQLRLGIRDVAFLKASRAEAQRQAEIAIQSERNRQRLVEEQRSAMRLRRFLIIMGGLLGVALVATVMALVSQHQAEQARSIAVFTQQTAVAENNLIDGQRLAYAAQKQRSTAPEVALLLASEAVQRLANPITEQSLREALESYPYSVRVLAGHTASLVNATFSQDGRVILTSSLDGTAQLWKVDGTKLTTFKGSGSGHMNAVLNSDGSRILVSSPDGTVELWNATGQRISILQERSSRQERSFDPTRTTFSPDGQRILITSPSGKVALWNSEGVLLANLQGADAITPGEGFSPDGQYVLTSSADGAAQLWNADGRLLITLQKHISNIVSASFSSDSKHIVTASIDKTVRVWSLDGALLTTLSGYTSAVKSATFSPDGTRILIISDGEVQVRRLNGILLAALRDHTSLIQNATFSPDGTRILTVSGDDTARLWDLDGTPLTTLQGKVPQEGVAFSPDSKRILTTSVEGTVWLWSLNNMLSITLQGHTDKVVSVAFSPDGTRLLTASADGTARIWSLDDTVLVTLPGHTNTQVTNAVFSPDRKHILTISQGDQTQIWSLDGRQHIALHRQGGPDVGPMGPTSVRRAAFSPDGSRIVTTGLDDFALLWTAEGTPLAVLKGHGAPVRSAVFSPDGTRILTASVDGTARVWSLDGIQIAILKGHSAEVMSAVFSSDGTRILTTSVDQTVRVWKVDGAQLTVLQDRVPTQISAQFSPDGSHLLTASGQDGGKVRIWNVEGTPIASFGREMISVQSATFSPDGTRILATYSDHTVGVWSINGTLLFTLQGHSDALRTAEFSRDGSHIVTTDWGDTTRVWSINGAPLAALQGSVVGTEFSSDGTHIFTVASDGTVRAHLLRIENLLTEAACRLPRNLTTDEIKRFDIGSPRFDRTKYQCLPTIKP